MEFLNEHDGWFQSIPWIRMKLKNGQGWILLAIDYHDQNAQFQQALGGEQIKSSKITSGSSQ